MNKQQTAHFEAFARSRGLAVNKERGRYCQAVVNDMFAAVDAALAHEALQKPAALPQKLTPEQA